MKKIWIKTAHYSGLAGIDKKSYSNGRVALLIMNVDNGQRVMTATTNIPDFRFQGLDDGTHVLIKDWSENEGILDSLIENEIVEYTGGLVATGFSEAKLCKLLESKKQPKIHFNQSE